MPTAERHFPTPGLSHVIGRRAAPLLELTLPDLMRQTCEAHGTREAAVFCAEGLRWSYDAFAQQVDRLAGGLLRLGFQPGERIGIWSPNRPEWLLAQFATARIGAILVCVNPAYRPAELAYALEKVGCAGLITARSFKGSDYIAMLGEVLPGLGAADTVLPLPALPSLRQIIAMGDAQSTPPGTIAFDAVCQMGDAVGAPELDAISARLRPDDPINIQFTSGTTGSPKGATLTHRNIINNARFVAEAIELRAGGRLCIPVPFYHCFGMVMGTLGCVTQGATMVIPGEGFDPLATLRAVAQERCTSLFGVPTMFLAELDHPEFATFDLSTLRTGIMAGALCPIEIMRRVQADMHLSGITIAYGMTETSPVSFQSATDDPLDKRVSSVGRVHPHVEVRIVDAAGRTLPTGAQGELLTRGYSVMHGYWGEAEKTAHSIDAEGWMHTGDLATIDAEGYCEITGRLKDMINRGGENIYPREIEDFLFTHPGVSQAQVFGIPDDRFGEIAVAWIIPKENQTLTPEQIKAFCRAHIAHFKVPAHVQMVEAYPMTVTGKPQKFLMREAMIAQMQGAAADGAGSGR